MLNQNLVATGTVTINATPEQVWNVLTTPSLIAEFLYGTETVTDWVPGHPIVFQGEYEGHKYRDAGTVLEFTPHSKIRYSYWSGFSGLPELPENHSEIEYLLEPESTGITKFSWIQKGYVAEANRDHTQQSMPAFLEQIKVIAEREAA